MRALQWILAFVFAASLPLSASGAEFKVPPTPSHYVTDTGSALGETTRAALETTLRKYERATGNQIVVYIADTTGGVPLEDWTAETADTWKVGHKKSDNGAVLFLFTGDRKVRIEVGYGLESALTDADAKRIIDTQIVPRMKTGDIDDAIGDGVGGMLHQITPSFAIPPPSHAPEKADGESGSGAGDQTLWIAILLIAMVALAIYSNWRNTKGGYWSGSYVGGSFGGGGGGGFSAGGGGFGGGGASGGW